MAEQNNMDMMKLMSMLSKMDKTQLEQGLAKVNQMLSSEDKEKLMNTLKQNMNNYKQ